MKKIIASMLANDLVNIEKRWLDIRAIFNNKNLRQQIVNKLAEKIKNTDFILLEAGNRESIFWGTLLALENKKPVIMKIQYFYKTINMSELCWSLESVSEGFPKSFREAGDFHPADSNDLGVVISAIASKLFPGNYSDSPDAMIIDPKLEGNSTAFYSEEKMKKWRFNISWAIEESPNISGKTVSGIHMSKEYQERLRSNMVVLRNYEIIGNENSLMSWQEIADHERVLMNPKK